MPPLKNPRREKFAELIAKGKTSREAAREADLRIHTHPTRHPRQSYVYGLLDESGDVFYVGKGTGRRWRDHFVENISGGNSAKRMIAKNQHRQACVIFAEDMTHDEAFDLESEVIDMLRHTLTNIAPGSRSTRLRGYQRAAELLSRVIPYDVWVKTEKGKKPENRVMYRELVSSLRRTMELSCVPN